MHALLTSSLVPLVLAVMLLNHYPDVGSKAAGVKEETFAYPVWIILLALAGTDAASSLAAYYAKGGVFCILTFGQCIVTKTCQLVIIAIFQVFQYRDSFLLCEQTGPHNPWHCEDRPSVYA